MAGRKRSAPGSSRKPTGHTASASSNADAVPKIYRQMLSDADMRPSSSEPERPVKRMRPGQRRAIQRTSKEMLASTPTHPVRADDEGEDDEEIEFEDVALPAPTVQTMYRDSDDEDDEELELQLEDVDFAFPDSEPGPEEPPHKEIQLDLSARVQGTSRIVDRRKPITKAEKDRRIEIHKTHLLCLMAHAARRNRWCNDEVVQETLHRLLSRKIIKFLNPPSHLSQFGQAESLKKGLAELETIFKAMYQVTERGLRRALWADKEEHLQDYKLPDDVESTMEKSDFRQAAQSLRGSRDVGAQLYCALLRSAGVEARLVCSLQPLSFVSGGPTTNKPPKLKQKLSLEERYARIPKYDSSFSGPASTSKTPSARQRLGHPNATAFEVPVIAGQSSARQVEVTPKKIHESPFPVYWVEILDVGHQKWQPVDPLVTQSFWKPRIFEPPASDRENCMTYVVSFEADGSAKDITRRYAKAYNAKTRKLRIENVIPNGERWWRKALRAYDRGYATDMDQIEANELTAIEAREPMPRNVADFKDHPIYALERHLRRHEVLVPGASAAGTVGAGSKGPLERIYRRKDVRIARTREKWYRLGREVPADEIPVKFLPGRSTKQLDVFGDEEDASDGDSGGTPIFTFDQTIPYKAPPIVSGIIPKNRFGNIDLYVPSMTPEGGAYVPDDLGAHAAFILGVDYAPALTGFRFNGRQGTAMLQGVVVAAEHEEAVLAVISGMKELQEDAERQGRTREVLRTWRRFLMNLRIRESIWGGHEEVEEDMIDHDNDDSDTSKGKGITEEGHEDDEMDSYASEEGDGGFVVEDDDDLGGGFL